MTIIQPRKRLSSGEPTLDAMMGGGFIEGSATLISGAPGVGKTTLGMQFLVAGAANGEAGIMVTFEEFPASLLRDAKNVGWDLQELQEDGLLKIIFTSPEVFLGSLQAPDSTRPSFADGCRIPIGVGIIGKAPAGANGDASKRPGIPRRRVGCLRDCRAPEEIKAYDPSG